MRSSPASMARFQEWRHAVKSCADSHVTRAAVVVYVQNPDEVSTWRRLAATADISVARAGTDERRIPFRLAELLTAADVVMATTLTIALEALARTTPVIVLPTMDGTGAPELARFGRVYASTPERLIVTPHVQDAVAQISSALGRERSPRRHEQASAIVRESGADTGAERVYQLLDNLATHESSTQAPSRPRAWQRLLILLCGCLARRFATRANGPTLSLR
jgi:hypothetical protein